jgi:hypothetical protein
VIPVALKSSLISGCSKNVDPDEHTFCVGANSPSSLHGFACNGLPLLGGSGIETPHPICKDRPS